MNSGSTAILQPRLEWRGQAPVVAGALAFLVLFWQPLHSLAAQWLQDPDAGHGLLLVPLALVLAWKKGLAEEARPQPYLGMALLAGAVTLRYVSGLAAELYTMRLSGLAALAALAIFAFGVRQLFHWWLPAALLFLSIPLPAVLTTTLALPLQLEASRMGAALLEWRRVPVLLTGNVIHLPGQSLFVTEACSGLRSLTALLALGVLIGGIWLRSPWLRIVLLALTIPVAMLINGFRVFATGFLVFFVDPGLGEGFMHVTEGWVLFVVAFVVLGGAAWLFAQLEGRLRKTAEEGS